ncbi:MAG: DUF2339 domain-containing protein [Methylotenera sp.]|nr:DUF2339 domain-containing protein [Methylotenera sp.]
MDSLFLMLGLLGLVVTIGGIVSFFSLFTSNNKDTRIREIERETNKLNLEITRLSTRLDDLKKGLNNQAQQAATPQAALKADAPTIVVEPTPEANEVIASQVSLIPEDDLIAQALAAAKAESITLAEPVQASNTNAYASQTSAKPPTPVVTKPVYTRPPIKSAEPNFIERGITYAKDWLFGGNTLVRSGIVILFIGVSFLIKYAAERTQVPIELRLMGIVLGGIALLVLGWRLRDKRPQYSWALQGGGIGILYLTIFAALKLYQLIPAGPAFALLTVVAFLSGFIAVKQSAMPLAILGFTGGFLAPVLTSTGQGSHVGLFSYYLVLNLAIAFVAFHKSWRPLNVLGWAFTFIIGTLWGAKSYVPEHFSTTEPFLVIFFLLFTAIAVLYAHKQATKASDYVDATLVFGTPLVSFSLQYALLRDSPFGLAYSALALGIFYLGLAWWVKTRKRETLKFLGECFLALGVGFLTLTLPLALDGRWTSAAWAVEGVGLLWVGLKQNRNVPALSGLALQLLGAGAFVFGWGLTGHTAAASQNMFLGVGFIALSGWACGALWDAYRPNKLTILSTLLALWGWLWWVASGLTAIDEFMPSKTFAHAGLIFVALTSLLLPLLANQFKWQKLSSLTTLLLPAMLVAVLWEVVNSLFTSRYSIFEYYGFIAWPFAFATYAWLISRNFVPNKAWLRAPLLWLIAAIGILEWQHRLWTYVSESIVWSDIGWGIVPMLIVGAVTYWQFAKKSNLNTMQLNSARTWAWVGSVPLMAGIILWYLFMSLNSSGNAAPLRYIPLLNPLDIALAGALLLLLIWQRALNKHLGKLQHINPILAGIMAFTLLNGMLLRTLHHWVGTPHFWVSIFNNSTVQMSFTILWGLTAFALMLFGHKRMQRQLWIVGAGLMAAVVAKLFLLDMAQTDSVERIVSFIGAGLMLLVMGYFAPLPPAKTNTTKEVSA